MKIFWWVTLTYWFRQLEHGVAPVREAAVRQVEASHSRESGRQLPHSAQLSGEGCRQEGRRIPQQALSMGTLRDRAGG